jgi:hypothetical protein
MKERKQKEMGEGGGRKKGEKKEGIKRCEILKALE